MMTTAVTTQAVDLDAAYAECARITRREAKNFAYGIALLPRAKRNAMAALYAMARRIDDVADSDATAEHKLTELERLDAQIDALASGEVADPNDAVLVGLHHAAASFAIPVPALGEIVEGCRRDSSGTIYRTFADTEEYCRLVAGSVGRLSLGVFGTSAATDEARVLADDLGVALQVTNILRDIVEDREMGRVYLPADDVERLGLGTELVRHYVEVAEGFYARGLPLLELLDHRSRACVAAMAGIYHRLLGKIAAAPEAVLQRRVSLSTTEKLRVAARALAGRRS